MRADLVRDETLLVEDARAGTFAVLAGLEVEAVRKDIPNLYLPVYPPLGHVRVAVPLCVPDEALRLAVPRRSAWIRRERQRFQDQARQTERDLVGGESHHPWGRRYQMRVVERHRAHRVTLKFAHMELSATPGTTAEARGQLLARWYRQQLRAALAELLPKCEARIGAKVDSVGIKRMKTFGGLCKPDMRHVWFNPNLAKKPRSCREYVVVHELVRLHNSSHGPAFVALMDEHVPRWRVLRAELDSALLTSEDWAGDEGERPQHHEGA